MLIDVSGGPQTICLRVSFFAIIQILHRFYLPSLRILRGKGIVIKRIVTIGAVSEDIGKTVIPMVPTHFQKGKK